MCFFCQGGTVAEYNDTVSANISKTGWHLTGVEASPGQPRWVYTIGLIESFEHPELVVVGGCCIDCSGAQLNDLGRLVEAGTRFSESAAVCDCHAGGPARFGRVHPGHWQTDRFAAWTNYYAPLDGPVQPEALQVINPAGPGLWQDDVASWRKFRLDRPPLRHARHRR